VAQLYSRIPNPAGGLLACPETPPADGRGPQRSGWRLGGFVKTGVDVSEQRKFWGQWLLFGALVAAAWLLVGAAVWPFLTGR